MGSIFHILVLIALGITCLSIVIRERKRAVSAPARKTKTTLALGSFLAALAFVAALFLILVQTGLMII